MTNLLTHAVTKNDTHYTITAVRETLPGQSRNRYRVWVRVNWDDGVAKNDIIAASKFNSAADCQNFALLAAADWLRK